MLSIGALARAHEQSPTTFEKNTAAAAKLSSIAELAKKPDTRTIEQLADKLHFTYHISSCTKTDQFEMFCQYQVIEQEPAVGHILILALGRGKQAIQSGGRLVWGMGKDSGCISKGTAAAVFGPGKDRYENISEPIPGQPINTSKADTSELIYKSIPDSTPSASAVVSFRNNCVNQVFLDF